MTLPRNIGATVIIVTMISAHRQCTAATTNGHFLFISPRTWCLQSSNERQQYTEYRSIDNILTVYYKFIFVQLISRVRATFFLGSRRVHHTDQKFFFAIPQTCWARANKSRVEFKRRRGTTRTMGEGAYLARSLESVPTRKVATLIIYEVQQ